MKSRKLNLSSILENNLLDSEGLIKKLKEKGIYCIRGFQEIGKIKYKMEFRLGIKGQIVINYLKDEFFSHLKVIESYKNFLSLEKKSRFHITSIKFKDGREYIE
jgi:hypothetical protein